MPEMRPLLSRNEPLPYSGPQPHRDHAKVLVAYGPKFGDLSQPSGEYLGQAQQRLDVSSTPPDITAPSSWAQ